MQTTKRNFISKGTYVLVLSFIATIFISCSKDENDTPSPVVEKPIITLVNPDTNFINCGSSESISIDLLAQSNLISGKALAGFKITSKFSDEALVTVMDSVISNNEFALFNYPIDAFDCNTFGTEIWTFRVTDVAGQFQELKLTLNITFYPPPGLAFLSGEYEPGKDRVDSDVTLTVGEQFVFGIAGISNSDNNLKRLLIQREFENVSAMTILDSTFNNSSITFDIICFAYPAVGAEDFECTLWDSNDKSTTISFTVTTEAAASDITIFTDIILGAQDNNLDGNFFASFDGTIYNQADAKINYDKVDFLYYYGASNLATLAAPDDADAATIYNNAVNGLQTWPDLNPTRFKTTMYSSTDFNAITSSNQIVAIAAYPAPNESDATDLAVGDVLAFKTVDDMYALIRIDAITTAGTYPSIEITVKVQN